MEEKSFSTEEQIKEGAKAMAATPDVSVESVEGAVVMGVTIWDDEFVHARLIEEGDDLIYHIFRGEAVSETYWGKGDFGVAVLEASNTVWRFSEPKVGFVAEGVRPEAAKDDPRVPSKFGTHYYGLYAVIVPNAKARPVPPSESRIKKVPELVATEVKKGLKLNDATA